jgi:hypothetical protein
VANYVYASSQGQGMHSDRTKENVRKEGFYDTAIFYTGKNDKVWHFHLETNYKK